MTATATSSAFHQGTPTGKPTAAAEPSAPIDKTVHMLLPQPVPEPFSKEEGQRWLTGSKPLPQSARIVLGSELIAGLSEPKRRGTLVNVWASWCGSCRAEMPMLVEIGRRYASRGIEVEFVSVDEPEQGQAAVDALRARGGPRTTLIAHPKLGAFKRALSPIWKGSLPATFLYDNTGRLRYFWGAQVFEQELLPVLDGFLAGKDIDGMANFAVQRGPAHH